MRQRTENKNDVTRSSPPEAFLGKGDPKICSKYTGESPCQSVISIKLRKNFIEIALQHGCSPVNLLHIFRTHFHKKTSGGLLLCYPYEKLPFENSNSVDGLEHDKKK